jgi:alcohol dehydrogenase class IV
MLWASYYGGAAIAHAGTHLVHALSYPLGGKYHLPHGVANAILLAPCMRVVRPHAVEKFAQVWDLVPGADTRRSAEENPMRWWITLRRWSAGSTCRTTWKRLACRERHPSLSDAALNVKRLMNNAPCQVNHDEVQAIYRTLFPNIEIEGVNNA